MRVFPVRSRWIFLVALVLGVNEIYPCSTFMISRGECLVVAHNLDQDFFTPGMVHVHPRSERKRSVSLYDLGLRDQATPIVEWTSKYGSVTFGMLGRNLPDGGMNEIGLTVSEMGLGESVFEFDGSRPAMLSHLWIQYQLDNFSSVDEVLAHLHDFNIDTGSTFTPPASANYHLFVTDRGGNLAIIEFLQGGPRIYRNRTAPVPVLCNTPYARELDTLERYRGVLGWFRRHLDSGRDLRFVTGALAIEQIDQENDVDPVGFSFETLRAMQFDRTKQWSVVYDVRNRRVYFQTARSEQRSYFDLEDFDFGSGTRSLVLEGIDNQREGDVSGGFVEQTREIDRHIISEFLTSLVQFVSGTKNRAAMDQYMTEMYGFEVEHYVDRALQISELIRSSTR